MGGFDVIALQNICATYFESKVAPLLADIQRREEELRTQVKDLQLRLEQKTAVGTVSPIEKFDGLVAEVAEKARSDKLDEQMDSKAGSEVSTESTEHATELPSMAQFEVWLSEVEQRLREQATTTTAQLEERIGKTERTIRSHAAKLEEFRKFDHELQCKANVRDVPTSQQFQRLSATVEKKAHVSKVPTVAQFEELQELLHKKVNAEWVPSIAQFEELAVQVRNKASASTVPSASDLQKVRHDLEQKANIIDVPSSAWIEEVLAQKSSAEQAQATKAVENLGTIMERKLAFLANKMQKTQDQVDGFLGHGMICYMPMSQPAGTWAPVPAEGQWQYQVVQSSEPMDTRQYQDNPGAPSGQQTQPAPQEEMSQESRVPAAAGVWTS
jgi:hypothetical protein